jgi:hypothetical protein
MSKLTTEKFLKKQKGVSVYWFTEGNNTTKIPSTLPSTKVTNQYSGKPLLDNFNTNPKPPEAPQNQKAWSSEEVQQMMNKTTEEMNKLRQQLTLSQETQEILKNQPGLNLEKKEQEIGNQAVAEMPNPKQAESLWGKMKGGINDMFKGANNKWNSVPKWQKIAILSAIALGTAPVALGGTAFAATVFAGTPLASLGYGGLASLGVGGATGIGLKAAALGVMGGSFLGVGAEALTRKKPLEQNQPSTENLDQPTQTPTIPTEQAKVEAESGEKRIDLVIKSMENGHTTNFNGIKITFVKTPDNKTAIAEITLENGDKSTALTAELLNSDPKLVAHLEKELKIEPLTETTSSSNESKSPETEISGLEAKIDRAIEFLLRNSVSNIENIKNGIKIKLNGEDVTINHFSLTGKYNLFNNRGETIKSFNPLEVKQFLQENPNILNQILKEQIKQTQEKLDTYEANENYGYYKFSSPQGDLKIPIYLNVSSGILFSRDPNNNNILKQAGLYIPPLTEEKRSNKEYFSIAKNMFRLGEEYGDFKFINRIDKETTTSKNESKSPENSEKSLEQRVDAALDTLVKKLKGDITIDLKDSGKLTFRADNGNLFLADNNGKEVELTERTKEEVIKFIAGELGRVKALEDSVKSLNQSSELPEGEKNEPKNVNELLEVISAETPTTTPEITEPPTTPEAKSPEVKSEFGELNTVEAVNGYNELRESVSEVSQGKEFKEEMKLFQEDLELIDPTGLKAKQVIQDALGLKGEHSNEYVATAMENAIALSKMRELPDYVVDSINTVDPKSSLELVNKINDVKLTLKEAEEKPEKAEAMKSIPSIFRIIEKYSQAAKFMQVMKTFAEDIFKYGQEGLKVEQTLQNIVAGKNEEPTASMLEAISQEEGGKEIAKLIVKNTPEEISNILNNPGNHQQKLQLHQAISKMAGMAGVKYEVPQTITNQVSVENYNKLDTKEAVADYLKNHKGQKVWMKLKGTDIFEQVVPKINTGVSGGEWILGSIEVGLGGMERKIGADDITLAVEPPVSQE